MKDPLTIDTLVAQLLEIREKYGNLSCVMPTDANGDEWVRFTLISDGGMVYFLEDEDSEWRYIDG